MKKTGTLLLLFFVCTLPALSAQTVKQPVQLVIAKDTWNFGTIKINKTVKHTFIIENKGKSPITIEAVIEGCSCLSAELADKKILPGKKTQLKVTYEAGGAAGEITRTIQLVTDDTQEPVKTLHVLGEIIE
jgi:hypothetical protein